MHPCGGVLIALPDVGSLILTVGRTTSEAENLDCVSGEQQLSRRAGMHLLLSVSLPAGTMQPAATSSCNSDVPCNEGLIVP